MSPAARAFALATAVVLLLCSSIPGCFLGASDETDPGTSGSLMLSHHSADEEGDSDFVSYCADVNHINNAYTGGEDVYASSSLGCAAGVYDPYIGQWVYWLDLDGEGWASDDIIQAAAFEIDGTGCSEALVLDMVDNSRYLWSIPSSTSGSDLDQISEFIVGLAMSAISNAGASIAWTLASELISCFGDYDANSVVNRDNYAWRLWQWSPNEPEVSQYARFMVFVDPGETVSFTAEYMLFGYGYEYVCGGLYEVTITAPTDPTADGTDVDVDGSGSAVAADADGSLGCGDVSSAACISEDTAYVDANPQVTIAVSDPTAALHSCIEDADGLLEACVAQISRSVKIVSAFSAGEVSVRNAEVVERNQGLIDSMRAIVESIEAGCPEGLEQLYAEFLAATSVGSSASGVVLAAATLELRIR